MREFGIESLPETSISHPYFRSGIVFGHRDLERILRQIRARAPFAVMSGIKPTAEYHLGSKKILDLVVLFQNLGGTPFFCIADIEAYLDNGLTPRQTCETAVHNLADALSLGLEPSKSVIYAQSSQPKVKQLAYLFAKRLTMNQLEGLYGPRTFAMYLAAVTVAADILLPQHEEMFGPIPTLVPVGVDQDPHLRLARDMASCFELVKPSGQLAKLTSSLNGEKMSKRNPNSCLFLNDDFNSATHKLAKAITGGQPTVEEQRRYGGNPDQCPVFETYSYIPQVSSKQSERIAQECRSGSRLCGECKQECARKLCSFLEAHMRKRQEMLPLAREMLFRKLA